MPKLTIESDLDPITTAYVLQFVNRRCRIFRGFENEPELVHSYESKQGTVCVHYIKDPAGDHIHISLERNAPQLKVINGTG
jgi:hypothetical protein